MKKGNEGAIKTAADLKGKKVGVGLGTNYEEWLRQNVQGVDVRTYDDDPTKYQDLRVGRIDAILVDPSGGVGSGEENQQYAGGNRRSLLSSGSWRCAAVKATTTC
ncbi:Cystine ABC transporter, periplasmic cystine-binding protein FliY [Klebsiella aerogenes]|nr:Cystine ABC transporter, periplasmic cystine-binding protein FliY [Klebsiella aerogenes]